MDEIQSVEEFVRLRSSEDKAEYDRAAHASAPEAVWLDVVARYPDMRKWVAHNKTVPVTVLDVLASDAEPEVRWTVAMKRKAGPDILGRLATDSDASVRIRVALNAKTPREALERLANDLEEDVAAAARERLTESRIAPLLKE